MTNLEVLHAQLNDLREKIEGIKTSAAHNHTCCCIKSSYCIDCLACAYCYLCFSCTHCLRCNDCRYCSICIDCRDCFCCCNCVDCSDCYGCSNITGKKYMVYNIQLTKEEYHKVMKEIH